MANEVKLTFAGDEKPLSKSTKKASEDVKGFTDDVTAAQRQQEEAGKSTAGLTDRLSKLGNITSGATDALDSIGGGLQSLTDLQSAAAERASRLARAQLDVAQATEDAQQATRDLAQAGIDGRQAQLDATQAALDQKVALADYNAAVKEHGKNSFEAQQAQIDLKQAGIDLAQANEDSAQATRDAAQANIDAKTAQQDLTDAQREANPPDMSKWTEQIGLVTPLLSSLVGVVGLATAAQWSLNLAWLASPITWIVVGIAAIVAAIVLIATKTDWFQKAWSKSWGWIKSAASSTWEFIKKIPGWIGTAFSKVSNAISSPFKSAFNFVADAWNNTVGKLNFSIPSWVPGIGGNSFGVPDIPKFHTGGIVSGAMGAESLALLESGEKITAGRHGDSGEATLRVAGGGSSTDRAMAEMIATLINRGALKLTITNGRVAASHG